MRKFLFRSWHKHLGDSVAKLENRDVSQRAPSFQTDFATSEAKLTVDAYLRLEAVLKEVERTGTADSDGMLPS